MGRSLSFRDERWPLAQPFVISRGAKAEAHVVVVELYDAAVRGRGEAVPYARYGETVEGVVDQIASVRRAFEAGLDRAALQALLPPGAARNALDCALWDLDAKQAGVRAWALAGRAHLRPLETAYTISVGEVAAMRAAAQANAQRPILKVKIGGPDDLDGVAAVRAAAPAARIIVDANEALTFEDFRRLVGEFAALGVDLVEQPLPAGADEPLEGFQSPVPLCADESLHTRAELATCARRYTVANIKLDKTGGLTEALALAAETRERGLGVMVGCMVATSLAMAPAMVVAQDADFVDLDGPLLLTRDREPALPIAGSIIGAPPAALWG